jgi:competence protein ComEC
MKVLQYPLTQITLFLVFGIVFNRYVDIGFTTGLILLAVNFSTLLIVFLLLRVKSNRLLTKVFTAVCLLLAFTVGNFSGLLHQDDNDPKHYSHALSGFKESVKLKVVLVERWKPTAKNDRFVAEIYQLNNQLATGKILVNFKRDKTTIDPKIGMKLAISAPIFLLQKPLNPDQFDYGAFLKNKSIYGQVYTDDLSISVFSTTDKSMYYYSAVFRSRVIENLRESSLNEKELGVVHALILGQRQDLDPTVLQNYQHAGVIHILSVSGLHVGFVLLFLNFFLNFLPNTNRFRVFKVLTLIIILWSFALVAGFTPSVVRSVTMFSFVAIGMYMRRKTYIFYTFYCSIFLILLFEPSFLFDVGFQLSYLALFFILWLQPEFARIWQPKNKIASHLWDVFTITIAAQLGTMPLSLYYFHQFPGLFFMANLLIMFLITVIMGVGLILVLIAYWAVIPTFMSKILEKLIWFLNFIVEKIASFEAFIFKDIPFDFWMMTSLFLAVFAFGWFVIRQNFRTSALFLFSILLFQISYFSFDLNNRGKNELVIFEARYSSLIAERMGNKIAVFSNHLDTTSIKNDRNIQSFNVANGTNVVEIKKIPSLLFFKGKKILILDSTAVFVPDLKPNVILITQSPKMNFERVLTHYQPEIVIADASNYKNVVEQLNKTCVQQKIPFHAIAEKGFYKLED